MSEKWKHAPVYFTIAQVRHNPVLSLDGYLPGIQENMRKAGYPDFRKGISVAFNLVAAGSDQFPSPQRLERWTFLNRETSRGFVLQQNSLSYEATEYDTFEVFSEEFRKGLEIVHRAVGLDFSERVGIRYLDAVVPRANEQLRHYLVPEVLGLGERLAEAQIGHSFSETLVVVPDVGQAVARVIIQDGRLGFPPDLQPENLKVPDRFSKVEQVHAVLDTDASFEGREAFDVRALTKRLDALHEEIAKLFRMTTTDHARATWR